MFIQNLCFTLGMDKKDLFAFFLNLRQEKSEEEIYTMLENYEINKLDINRIYRYLDKYSQEEDEIHNVQDDDASSVASNII